MDMNAKLCPMLNACNRNEDFLIVCKKWDCAWYDGCERKCSMLSLVDRLAALEGSGAQSGEITLTASECLATAAYLTHYREKVEFGSKLDAEVCALVDKLSKPFGLED